MASPTLADVALAGEVSEAAIVDAVEHAMDDEATYCQRPPAFAQSDM
ncbi:MAG: hypothetical protein WBV53_12145 [Solirubrobacterales bacterium]